MDGVGGDSREIMILLDSAEVAASFPSHCQGGIPAEGPGKRVCLEHSAIQLTPLQGVPGGPGDDTGRIAGRTELRALMSAKVDVTLPAWIVNLAVDAMSCLVLYCLCAQAANIGRSSVYQQRLAQTDDRFLALMRRRLADVQG